MCSGRYLVLAVTEIVFGKKNAAVEEMYFGNYMKNTWESGFRHRVNEFKCSV
jgi:hypothetical protein